MKLLHLLFESQYYKKLMLQMKWGHFLFSLIVGIFSVFADLTDLLYMVYGNGMHVCYIHKGTFSDLK